MVQDNDPTTEERGVEDRVPDPERGDKRQEANMSPPLEPSAVECQSTGTDPQGSGRMTPLSKSGDLDNGVPTPEDESSIPGAEAGAEPVTEAVAEAIHSGPPEPDSNDNSKVADDKPPDLKPGAPKAVQVDSDRSSSSSYASKHSYRYRAKEVIELLPRPRQYKKSKETRLPPPSMMSWMKPGRQRGPARSRRHGPPPPKPPRKSRRSRSRSRSTSTSTTSTSSSSSPSSSRSPSLSSGPSEFALTSKTRDGVIGLPAEFVPLPGSSASGSRRSSVCSAQDLITKTREGVLGRPAAFVPLPSSHSGSSVASSRGKKSRRSRSGSGSRTGSTSSSTGSSYIRNNHGMRRPPPGMPMKRHEDEPDPPPPFQALEIDPTKMEDESPSRLEWLRQKTELGEENEPLDRLMCMVGLEDVKAHFLLVKARVEAAKRRDAMGELRLDLVLMGSLGTGKRTVAHLYGDFLESLDVVPKHSMIQTPAPMLPHFPRTGRRVEYSPKSLNRPDAYTHQDKQIVFFDKVHKFSRGLHDIDATVQMSDNRTTLLYSCRHLVGGHQFHASPDVKWRLPTVLKLPDYDDEELLALLIRLFKHHGLSVEGGFEDRCTAFIVKRVGRKRGLGTYGNTRTLQGEFEMILDRQAMRLREEWFEWTKRKEAKEKEAKEKEAKEKEAKKKEAKEKEAKEKVAKEKEAEEKEVKEKEVKEKEAEEKEVKEKEAKDKVATEKEGQEKEKEKENKVEAKLQEQSQEEESKSGPDDTITSGEKREGGTEPAESNTVEIKSNQDNSQRDNSAEEVREERTAVKSQPGPLDTSGEQGKEGAGVESKDNKVDVDNEKVEVDILGEKEKTPLEVKPSPWGLWSSKPKRGKATRRDARKGFSKRPPSPSPPPRNTRRPPSPPPKNTTSSLDKKKDTAEPEPDDPSNPRPNNLLVTRADIYGPEPADLSSLSSAWQELQSMVGLTSVKESILELLGRAKYNYHREISGQEPLHTPLNRVFLGPPGTGKTTVARLYGQIVADMGLVSTGDVITKTTGDFMSWKVGESEEKAANILDGAQGKVLIIDDAHAFYHMAGTGINIQDRMRHGIIETLVAKISGAPGEDRCVILTGYPDEMEEMFQNSNAGLRRRFPEEQTFHFGNYGEQELAQILDKKLADYGLVATEEARRVALDVVDKMRVRPNFGNGADVDNLISRAKAEHRKRALLTPSSGAKDRIDPTTNEALNPEDFDPDYTRSSQAATITRDLFSSFVGFESIIDLFTGFQEMAAGMRLHGLDPRSYIPFSFVFKGPPGTGKTTSARLIGQIFYSMGFLSTDEVIECSASDLVGEWLGHTGPKVLNLLDKALGRVLFIDEAYRLSNGARGISGSNFHEEAVSELVDAMTKPRYHQNMIIILAGYDKEMDRLMDGNPGLRGRFATHVSFPQMAPKHCLYHLMQEIGKLNIEVRDEVDVGDEKSKKVVRLFSKLSATKNWANGRDVESLARTVITHVFRKQGRKESGRKEALTVSTDELIGFLQDMLEERKRRKDDEPAGK